MDYPVESSVDACLLAASWSLKWVAGIWSIEHVGATFAITGALISLVFVTGF
jgi:hypothetical protein